MSDIFKKRLKQLREKKGVTQKDVADAIGATAQSILTYEKGERMPNIDKAIKIARYFGVSLDWLCGLRDDTANATNRQIVHMLRVIAEKTGHTVSKIEGFKCSKDVEKYFADLEKMKGLLANGDIDQELFDLWEEKKNSEEWLDETFETEGEDDGQGAEIACLEGLDDWQADELARQATIRKRAIEKRIRDLTEGQP